METTPQIIEETQWSRECPKCHRHLTYKSKVGYEKAIMGNLNCQPCSSNKGRTWKWKDKSSKPVDKPMEVTPVIKYELLATVIVKANSSHQFTCELQVITFLCPKCDNEIQKRVATFGWNITASCEHCRNRYSLQVSPINTK